MVTGGKFYRNRSSLRCLRNKIPGHIGATGVLHCSEPPEELNNRINLSQSSFKASLRLQAVQCGKAEYEQPGASSKCHRILITFLKIVFPDLDVGHGNKTPLSDICRAVVAQELEDRALAWWQRSMRGGIKVQCRISVGGTVGLDVLGVADLVEMGSLQGWCWTCLRAFLASGTSVPRDDKS